MTKVHVEILGCLGLGFFTESDSSSNNQLLFVCESKTFDTLCTGLTQPCQCQSNALKVTKTIQVLHVFLRPFVTVHYRSFL